MFVSWLIDSYHQSCQYSLWYFLINFLMPAELVVLSHFIPDIGYLWLFCFVFFSRLAKGLSLLLIFWKSQFKWISLISALLTILPLIVLGLFYSSLSTFLRWEPRTWDYYFSNMSTWCYKIPSLYWFSSVLQILLCWFLFSSVYVFYFPEYSSLTRGVSELV